MNIRKITREKKKKKIKIGKITRGKGNKIEIKTEKKTKKIKAKE